MSSKSLFTLGSAQAGRLGSSPKSKSPKPFFDLGLLAISRLKLACSSKAPDVNYNYNIQGVHKSSKIIYIAGLGL
jgi:hypothetical protein